MKFGLQYCKVIIGIFAGIVCVAGMPDTSIAAWNTVVDGTSFNNVTAFQGKWSYDYPYGPVHNGGARMNQTNVTVSSGMVTLTSSPTNTPNEGTNQDGAPIHYNSGTFYLTQPITINQQYPIWDISAQFKVPVIKGTWPAIWLDGVNSWPPESDIMEYKGNSNCWQNTYDGSWQTQITPVQAADTSWHTYRLVAVLENTTNVDFHYYIDGVMESEQTSTTFVGSPCWLFIDYEMEGAGGTPGPNYATYVYVSNIVIKCEAVSAATGPIADGVYKMIARNTGDSLDVLNQNTTIGSDLDQKPYNGGLNEQWTLTYLGNSLYNIIGRQSGRALGVINASITNGAGADIEDYAESNDQKWQISATADGYYELINANSSKVLEVSDNSFVNAAVIDQWFAAGASHPQLTIQPLSQTNFALIGAFGVPGLSYMMTGTSNLSAAGPDWETVTNIVFDINGNFSSTNEVIAGTSSQFFQLVLPSGSWASNQQWTFQKP
jgi:hypothetical protein